MLGFFHTELLNTYLVGIHFNIHGLSYFFKLVLNVFEIQKWFGRFVKLLTDRKASRSFVKIEMLWKDTSFTCFILDKKRWSRTCECLSAFPGLYTIFMKNNCLIVGQCMSCKKPQCSINCFFLLI